MAMYSMGVDDETDGDEGEEDETDEREGVGVERETGFTGRDGLVAALRVSFLSEGACRGEGGRGAGSRKST